jgi:hypothetical protein
MDAVDADQPSQDLLALYLKSTPDNLLLRLDILDLPALCDFDLVVAIDNNPGGSRKILEEKNSAELSWDFLISIPAAGNIEVIDADRRLLSDPSILTIRNPGLDTIELAIQKSAIPGYITNPRFQVFTTPAGQKIISDSLAPVSLYDSPPPRAPILLAFWNSLPAYTPIQALRRWSGAHTGPLGGSHGLRYLLKAAQDYQTPLVLLDLKSVPTLPALEYLDAAHPIAEMARQGLLILPEVTPFSSMNSSDTLSIWGIERSLQLSRQTSVRLGLPASQFLYAVSPGRFPDSYRFVFLPEPVSGLHRSIQRYTSYNLLSIPQQDTTLQAGEGGPTIEIRRALVEAALFASSAQGTILVLGGDLSASTWGNPQYASATLRYLTAHPWIKLLDSQELLATQPAQSRQAKSTNSPLNPTLLIVLEELYRREKDAAGISLPLINNAWQTLLAYNAPLAPSPPELSDLRQQYLGQVVSLLSVAQWADHSTPIADCSQDIDRDGVSECVLASNEVFLIFEKDSGSLVYAFTRYDQRVHQWIAPTSQFIIGQSDPKTWQINAGLRADPTVIPGAFFDPENFTPLVEAGKITFQSPDLVKTYTLVNHGLIIEYDSAPTGAPRLPLAIDPWLRFTPEWGNRYSQESDGGRMIWGAPGQFRVQIDASAPIDVQTFNASRRLFSQPENPNLDYPPGNMLPFPLALIEINPTGPFTIHITWRPDIVTFP